MLLSGTRLLRFNTVLLFYKTVWFFIKATCFSKKQCCFFYKQCGFSQKQCCFLQKQDCFNQKQYCFSRKQCCFSLKLLPLLVFPQGHQQQFSQDAFAVGGWPKWHNHGECSGRGNTNQGKKNYKTCAPTLCKNMPY
jgi:hypothetical protein